MMKRTVVLAGLLALALAGLPQVALAVDPVDFTFDMVSEVPQSSGDPNLPYMWEYVLNLTNIPDEITYVNDLEMISPSIIPGYIEVTPPPNWDADTIIVGRAGFSANPGYEFSVEGQYAGFVVKYKYPFVEYGAATVTYNTVVVGGPVQTMVPTPEPATLSLLALGGLALLRRRMRK